MTISDILGHIAYTIPYAIVFPALNKHVYLFPFILSLFSRIVIMFTSYKQPDIITPYDSYHIK